MPTFDSFDAFESAFQTWLAAGSFQLPAMREGYERRLRAELDPAAMAALAAEKKVCLHGKAPLTCHECYFHGPGYLR